MKMMSWPMVAMFFCWPERNPSPSPTSISSDPTPQAMPNMVKKDRSLCAHKVRITWAKMSKAILIGTRSSTPDHLHWFQFIRPPGTVFVTGKKHLTTGNWQLAKKHLATSGWQLAKQHLV